jgi:hypothetical protein
MIGSIMGIVRAVRNSSILNVILSLLIPIYGLIYFFAWQTIAVKMI